MSIRDVRAVNWTILDLRFSCAYFTLCSPRSEPHTIWDFRQGFLVSILFYLILAVGHAQFGFLVSILLYIVLEAGRTQFGIFVSAF